MTFFCTDFAKISFTDIYFLFSPPVPALLPRRRRRVHHCHPEPPPGQRMRSGDPGHARADHQDVPLPVRGLIAYEGVREVAAANVFFLKKNNANLREKECGGRNSEMRSCPICAWAGRQVVK